MLTLKPYQELGADFLFENDRGMILAAVGAGKTALSMTAMWDMYRQGYVKRWLVLAPKRVARDVWPHERELWMQGLTMRVALGTAKQRKSALTDMSAHAVVATYDNIQSLTPEDMAGFQGIVFDELTKLKNPSGKRFKHLMGLIEDINIRWGLTGSFTSNGLEDTYGQCRSISEQILGEHKSRFLKEYFVLVNKDYGTWAPKGSSLEKVMKKIKPYTFLLENKEYVDGLPALNIVPVHIDMDMTLYREMQKNFLIKVDGRQVSAMSRSACSQKLQQMASGFIYPSKNCSEEELGGDEPIWLSGHKFDRLDEILEENQHAPTLIAYNFKEELEELRRRYPNLQGIDSPNTVERWNAGKIELLALHPKSASHGLNLQYGGNKLVFLSLPWPLELYEQMIGRLHRQGQKEEVWVYQLLTKGTLDFRVFSSLADKKDFSVESLEELEWQ